MDKVVFPGKGTLTHSAHTVAPHSLSVHPFIRTRTGTKWGERPIFENFPLFVNFCPFWAPGGVWKGVKRYFLHKTAQKKVKTMKGLR